MKNEKNDMLVFVCGDFLRPDPVNYYNATRIIDRLILGNFVSIEHSGNRSYSIWAKNYENYTSDNAYAELLSNEIVERKLIIGWEMPPALCVTLDNLGINFISLGVHPYRFAEDFFLYLNTNILYASELFVKHSRFDWAPHTEFRRKIRPNNKKTIDDKLLSIETLLIEQLPLDAASIYNGKFVGIVDLLEKYPSDNFKILYHPHSRYFSLYGISFNAYDYIFHMDYQMPTLVGVSSSLLLEADLLNCKNKKMFCHFSRMTNFSNLVVDVNSLYFLNKLLVAASNSQVMLRKDIISIRDSIGSNWDRKKT